MPTVHVDLADRSYDVIVEAGALAKAASHQGLTIFNTCLLKN